MPMISYTMQFKTIAFSQKNYNLKSGQLPYKFHLVYKKY